MPIEPYLRIILADDQEWRVTFAKVVPYKLTYFFVNS